VSQTLTQPSPEGRGLFYLVVLDIIRRAIAPTFPPRRLDRLAPPVEHPRHLHRLVRRDLPDRRPALT
jgi:hypothetical protein